MDPLSLAASAGAVAAAAAGFGTGLRMRQRLRRTEGSLAALRRELAAARHQAYHDPLTGLPNRRAFFLRGDALLADPARPALSCAVVDLDSFKELNDTLGHAAGDRVLVSVAERLASFAGRDLVARLGGDEFAALLTTGGAPAGATSSAGPRPAAGPPRRANAGHLTELLGAPVVIAGRWVRITASVGVAPAPPGADLRRVLHEADCAMYRAKLGWHRRLVGSHGDAPPPTADPSPLVETARR